MKKQKNDSPAVQTEEGSDAARAFKEAAEKLLSVPKAEIDRRDAQEKTAKRRKEK